LITSGSFDMGCTPEQEATDACSDDEFPVHTVTLTQNFWLGQTEVTQAEFESVMDYNPSHFTSCGADCPVDQVTWHQAATYANALSEAEGLESCYDCTEDGETHICVSEVNPYECAGYRFPTEAEWEYAARCGMDTVYSGSDDASEVAWSADNSGDTTHPVASLLPNACGLYDMSGNVWEWTGDWYSGSYYESSPSTNPSGPSSGPTRSKRGGPWYNPPFDLRVANRVPYYPVGIDGIFGFRLARTAL
ncbi:MAG: formylglycine-generating enzyme family protein, partial [Myxococcota bacterium]